ncbi:DNA-binding transcriptional LysR family regulator [Paraburkholderia sp. BL6669N2]|uniref:LysR substrate-binding domain-containing protein n=1 Tax=unclassified Paraburkholderia TaxID=2615204 RepID=UPI000E2389F4|nr:MULTISPECIES: LysR substrate-binding domain-containing protein [unclassified Paraburkholderia]REG51254.1 DNA-binding transcriptional LysR family regulator [Paraburkholderia sp. BL6669N2]TDY20329.1 DNA-binding transcriptional LysR family regulator [Paraburkholderia sp. BL6665CI2N2]
MARPLNFQQIQAFRAVMQMGTTTGAASMLNTTQPSISRRLAEMQSCTGLELFEMHQGRLRPTSEGKLLYKTVLKHFDGLEKIESAVAIMRKSGTGALRIGCTPTLGAGLLPQVVRAFLSEFPGTYLNMQTMNTPQLADLLRQDLFDVVLTTGKLDPRDFEPVIINTVPAVCVLPPGHRLHVEPQIHVSMLLDETMLSLGEADDLTIEIKKLMQAHGLSDNFLIETTSSIAICALVAAGNGIGIVNPYVASTFAGQLLIKPLVPTIDVAVQMAMPRHTAPSLLTRHFVDILLTHVNAIRTDPGC